MKLRFNLVTLSFIAVLLWIIPKPKLKGSAEDKDTAAVVFFLIIYDCWCQQFQEK
jgi:hypothetical protein